MRFSRVSQGLVLLAALATTSNALQVLSSSPCAVQCGNVLGSTSGDDLVCFDDRYGSPMGVVFENCMNCLLTSKYAAPAVKNAQQDTDLRWLLYNLRYTISWCLFGYPNNTQAGDTPCTTGPACGPLENAIEFDSLSPNSTTYSYCGLMLEKEISIPKCHSCLTQQEGQFYLTNMLTVLTGACKQQPLPGNIIALDGEIFSNVAMNVTDPAKAIASSFTNNKGGLSLGAKVGIAISGALLILAITGFCIICNGKRRRRRALAAHQKKTGYANWIAEQQASNPQQPPSMFEANHAETAFHDSPASQRPLVRGHLWGQPSSAVEESPASAFGEKAYFSPYSSQYSSPVSAHDQMQPMGRDWSMDRKGSIGGSIAGLGRSKSMEKRPVEDEEGDRIELQNVPPMHNVAPMQNAAPVLLHPANGRSRPPPGLSSGDFNRGGAI